MMEWLISILVILLASLLKGITGFGFALMALPILTIFFPMQLLVPAMTIFNLVTSIYILTKIKLKIKAKYVIPMLLTSFIGLPVGVYVLKYLPETTLELVTGISIFSISVFFLLGNMGELSEKKKSKPIVFAGFISGLMSSSMSIGGPAIALAMNRKGYSKEHFRKIFAVISVVNAAVASILYIAKGLFLPFSVKFSLVMFPILLIGSKIGNSLSGKVNQLQFKKAILYLNLILGLFIIIRTVI